MSVIKLSKRPFAVAEITEELRKARAHCLNLNSHFSVAAAGEYQLSEHEYALILGVNVEDAKLNRLSLHAEHSVLTNAQILLGERAKLNKLYVMGGIETALPGMSDGSADLACQMCGNCRQLILSSCLPDAVMYSITINGKISKAYSLKERLPDAFSEQDVRPVETKPNCPEVLTQSPSFDTHSAKYQYTNLLNRFTPLETDEILNYLCSLTPHIISKAYQTSKINSCIIKINHRGKPFYAAGTLVQDIAFLTADALFTALVCTVTEHGWHELVFDEIYLLVDKLTAVPLNGAELDLIGRFNKGNNIPIHVFTQEAVDHQAGAYEKLTLRECLEHFAAALMAF